jgi:hypothetical protein
MTEHRFITTVERVGKTAEQIAARRHYEREVRSLDIRAIKLGVIGALLFVAMLWMMQNPELFL